MRSAITSVCLGLAATLGLATSADAARTAEDAIKYRHAVMEEMAAHMSALTQILFDKVDGAEFAPGHADALVRATDEMRILFPDYSKDGDTHALPAVWENPEEFGQAVTKVEDQASAFRAALSGGDRAATLSAFADLGKACKGCHETYRAEEDHEH